MKNKSSAKSYKGCKSDRKYYKEILNTIDKIELALKNKLKDQDVQQTYNVPSVQMPRYQTPNNTLTTKHTQTHKNTQSITKKPSTPKSQKINRTRVQTQIEQTVPFPSTILVGSIPKTINFVSLSSTPKKSSSSKKKTIQPSRSQFCLPFDTCNLNIDEKGQENMGREHKQQSKSLWLRSNEYVQKDDFLDRNKKKMNHVLEEVSENEESARYSHIVNEKQIQGEVHKLESEFEGQLLKKRVNIPTPYEKQAYRSKMTQLSYRIAKLRERQQKYQCTLE